MTETGNNNNNFLNRMRAQVAAANQGNISQSPQGGAFTPGADGMLLTGGGMVPMGSTMAPKKVASGFTSL